MIVKVKEVTIFRSEYDIAAVRIYQLLETVFALIRLLWVEQNPSPGTGKINLILGIIGLNLPVAGLGLLSEGDCVQLGLARVLGKLDCLGSVLEE